MARQTITIESLDDPRVALFRNVRDADLRGGGGFAPRGGPANKHFMAESELVIRRLFESQRYAVASLFLCREKLDAMGDVVDRLPPETPVFVADDSVVQAISGYRHHGGVLAAGHRPSKLDLRFEHVLGDARQREICVFLFVEGVTNVDNIGSIFRNAAAFGVDGVVLDDACADPLFRKAIRVSMGHVFNVPWAVEEDWSERVELLKRQCGFQIVAAENLSGADATPLHEVLFGKRIAIILGSEKSGVRTESLSLADVVAAIPMSPVATSINVAVASAVVLYELRRQRP